ncbi:MAG: ice-binding family protein [Actinomycetota bacterium]|nr:ice-binding family protein [Actinomycetota bacterium]
MSHLTDLLRARRSRLVAPPAICSFVLAVLVTFAVASSAAAATAADVPLGTTDTFAILAGAGITSTGITTVNGDIGSYPTATITDGGILTVNGQNPATPTDTQVAQTDLGTAIGNATGQGPPTQTVAALANGDILTPGIYNSASTIGVSGTVTLDGGGDPDAVFLFQAGTALNVGSNSVIALAGGAQACNVFWQVGTAATLNGSFFAGTVLAGTSITMTSGNVVEGRLLAQTGSVTLDGNIITTPVCAPATTTTLGATTTTLGATTTTLGATTTTAAATTITAAATTTTLGATTTTAAATTTSGGGTSTTLPATTTTGPATTTTAPGTRTTVRAKKEQVQNRVPVPKRARNPFGLTG